MSNGSDIFPVINTVPVYEPIANMGSGHVSSIYERFLNQMVENSNSLLSKPLDNILRNSDFNYIRNKGFTPTTQADGDGAEFVEKWIVNGSGGGNAYTITPTAYPADDASQLGSKNFVNVNISSLSGGPVSIVNQNNTTEFGNAYAYQGRPMTFSAFINNNTPNSPKVRFQGETTGSSQITNSSLVSLRPGLNKISTTVNFPTLTPASTGNTNLKLLFEELDGGFLDVDLYYLKAEFGAISSALNLNHLLEKILLDSY